MTDPLTTNDMSRALRFAVKHATEHDSTLAAVPVSMARAAAAELDRLAAENAQLREAVRSFFHELSPIVNELYNGKLNGVSMRLAVSGDAMSIAKEIMRIAEPIRAALRNKP